MIIKSTKEQCRPCRNLYGGPRISSLVHGRRISRLLSCAAAAAVITAVSIPAPSFAFWPFTSSKNEDYVARVGREVITKEDFVEAINNLHKSNRVGKGLSEEESFAKQDYRKFLNELIDVKLFRIEAENMGFDKEPGFVGTMENYILNVNLNGLRQEEIVKKVAVTDKEIEDYYRDSVAKRKDAPEKAGKDGAVKETPTPPEGHPHIAHDDKKGADAQPSKEGDGAVKDADKIPQKERDRIRDKIYAGKVNERQAEFFALLRDKAAIKIDDAALKNLSEDKPETLDSAIAEVDGKAILGREITAFKDGKNGADTEEARRRYLDRLILHSLLDREAVKRNYASTPENMAKIKSYSDRLLVNEFKRKIIAASIKIDESETAEYYEKNKEGFKESDTADVGVIVVEKREKAEEILDEIKKGADFAYLASLKSIDQSGKSGGQVGKINLYSFPEDIRKTLLSAKSGEIIGPVEVSGAWAVIEFHGLIKGSYFPYESVKMDIAKTIGQDKYRAQSDEYLKRLRELVPIEINEEALRLFEGK